MTGPLSEVGPWDLVADGYAETTRHFLYRYGRSAISRLAPGPDDHVLDVAAGPGTLCVELSREVRSMTAVDFSPEMLAHCRRRAREEQSSNLSIEQGDGQALPFGNDEFDLAYSIFGLMFFPDRVAGFREMFRTLRPGGRVAVTSWQPAEVSPAFGLFMGAMAATGALPKSPPSPVAGLDDPQVFADEMKRAGFVDVTIEPIVHEMEFSSIDELWDQFERGNASVVLLKNRLGDAWEAAADKARAWLHEHAEVGRSYPAPAWVGVGRKD